VALPTSFFFDAVTNYIPGLMVRIAVLNGGPQSHDPSCEAPMMQRIMSVICCGSGRRPMQINSAMRFIATPNPVDNQGCQPQFFAKPGSTRRILDIKGGLYGYD
jgi:hypothetical protein